jgi:hypothetical protein
MENTYRIKSLHSAHPKKITLGQGCGSGMFMLDPRSEFFHPDPGSKRFRIPDPHQSILVFLTPKTVSKLSEKLSGMFILDPDSEFFSYPRSRRLKKPPDPGSGSATLPRERSKKLNNAANSFDK